MATFEQMRTTIADQLPRSDLNSQISQEINDAIEHYREEEFFFNQNIWGFKTKPATESMSFGSASVSDAAVFSIVVLTRSSNDIRPIDPISINTVRQQNTSGTNSTSPPFEYAIFNKRIFFSPIPDSSYSVDVYGIRAPATLSASADTNTFLTDGKKLIEARVRWAMWTRYLHDDEKAATAKSDELSEYGKLKKKTTSLLSTGRLKVWD